MEWDRLAEWMDVGWTDEDVYSFIRADLDEDDNHCDKTGITLPLLLRLGPCGVADVLPIADNRRGNERLYTWVNAFICWGNPFIIVIMVITIEQGLCLYLNGAMIRPDRKSKVDSSKCTRVHYECVTRRWVSASYPVLFTITRPSSSFAVHDHRVALATCFTAEQNTILWADKHGGALRFLREILLNSEYNTEDALLSDITGTTECWLYVIPVRYALSMSKHSTTKYRIHGLESSDSGAETCPTTS